MTRPAPATGIAAAPAELLAALADAPPAAWLERGRALALNGDLGAAAALLEAALARAPDDAELRLALASAHWQLGDLARADAELDALLGDRPDHVAAAFALARLRAGQGRVRAAEAALRTPFARIRQPSDLTVRAARMLAGWGRTAAAAEICEAQIALGDDDARLRVYAGLLLLKLGEFERSRERYRGAIERDPSMLEFDAAYAIAAARRYVDPADADIGWFERLLARPQLGSRARASLRFALGKIHDDLGEWARAAAYFRAANALVDRGGWSRKSWRRVVDVRMNAAPLPSRRPAAGEGVPVFVVGAPRSGTTLVAELLARSDQVRNRGELDQLPELAQQLARVVRPDAARLDAIAAAYWRELRQDDADAGWFIDKQPLNFLNLDLIAALFPQAHVVYCRRSSRDTALSIWMQHFESAEYRFAYDFDDIGAVLQGAARLLAKARRDARVRLHEVRYEALVAAPEAVVGELAAALGLAPFDCGAPARAATAIGTASVWQARQPVYTRAVGRWRAYAEFVPELRRFADD
ncbi:MAG TPA: sulfotransferase [Dokdonella sp.]